MNETPLPVFLVQSWLDVIQDENIPEPIKLKRMKLLKYYFETVELADMYLEKKHS